MKSLLILLIGFMYIQVTAQEIYATAKCNPDTLFLGNAAEVHFVIENNNDVKFLGPDMEICNIISGPNHSSSFSMINGEASQSLTISYLVKPEEVGEIEIGSAIFTDGENEYYTTPFSLVILPNPDGIKQNPQWPENAFPVFPKKEPKPKRKLYKM